MLSTSTPTLEFYSAIAKNPQLLANGYQLIRDYLLQDQQHRRDTILNLLNPTVPVMSLVLNLYPNEIFLSQLIDEAQKNSTVEFILNLLVQQLVKPSQAHHPKEVNQLIEFMHKVHNNLGFERWVGLYIKAFSVVAEQNRSKFADFLLCILRSADDRVSVLAQELMPKLIIFHFERPQDRLEIFYYVLKSLAYKVDSDPETIDSHVKPHLPSILSYTIANMQVSPTALKFSLKTMTLLFGDFGQPCPTPLITQIEETSEYLICQYIGFLNSSADFEKGEDDAEDEQQPIEMALYQMLELMMALFGSKAKINIQKVVYLCVISTFLGQGQYKNYLEFSDQYLMDVEDEGESNIRNKSTYFLNELIDHNKYGKKCIDFLRDYSTQIFLNLQNIEANVESYLKNKHLPNRTLSIPELYTESALFILYSFTDELLQGKVSEISSVLIQEVKASLPNSINPILSILILNKCARTGTQSQKHLYLTFLRSLIGPFCGNIGVLISVARGIFLFAPLTQLQITSNSQQGVPVALVNNLNQYMFRQDSAQEEAAYLILQFFSHLLKCNHNQSILQQIIPFEKQILLLKRFLPTGMTSKVVMHLTAKLANPRTLQAIFREIDHGFVKDQNLSEIISNCIKEQNITISQTQIIRLCQVYANRLDLIANIIGAFTERYALQNQELIDFLSKQGRRQWWPGLLKQGKLKHIQNHLISSVKLITHQIQSPELLENQLLVPYFCIINSTDTAISILSEQSLLFDFFEKIYRYARLFQGSYLKIMTSHIFISLAQKLPNLTPKVVELVKSYGNIDSGEWQDEDEFADVGQNFDFNQGFFDKLFSRIVNQRVEQVFKTVFGQLAWDSKRLYQRLASLESTN